jgi:hypothetical protein
MPSLEIKLVAILAFGTMAQVATAECPKQMPKAVEAKVLPILRAQADADARRADFDPTVEELLFDLLDRSDPVSIEAKVALMDYYLGEGNAESLVCSVALNGKAAESILLRYGTCDIQPSESPSPRDHTHPLRLQALKLIRSGKAKEGCTFE